MTKGFPIPRFFLGVALGNLGLPLGNLGVALGNLGVVLRKIIFHKLINTAQRTRESSLNPSFIKAGRPQN